MATLGLDTLNGGTLKAVQERNTPDEGVRLRPVGYGVAGRAYTSRHKADAAWGHAAYINAKGAAYSAETHAVLFSRKYQIRNTRS